jgi:hypothetical protein
MDHQWSGWRRLTKERSRAIPTRIPGARAWGMRGIVVEDHKKRIPTVKQLHYSMQR